jgi:hypothetical protein
VAFLKENAMNPRMLTIAIILLGIPSIAFAQSDKLLSNEVGEQQATPEAPKAPEQGALPGNDAPGSGEEGASGDYDGTADEAGGDDEGGGDGGDE